MVIALNAHQDITIMHNLDFVSEIQHTVYKQIFKVNASNVFLQQVYLLEFVIYLLKIVKLVSKTHAKNVKLIIISINFRNAKRYFQTVYKCYEMANVLIADRTIINHELEPVYGRYNFVNNMT